MLSKWSWILLNLVVYVSSFPSKSETKAFFQLIELDYEDACQTTADVQWSFIVSPSNETLSALEAQQYEYAKFKKSRKAEVHNITTDNARRRFEPFLQHKYSVIDKPGDALLDEEDWKELVHFAGVVELQRSAINKTQNYSRADIEYLLSHGGKIENKRDAWNDWYRHLKPLVTNYSSNLPLVAKAAKENDAKNVEKYWEMLSVYLDGYDKIISEWSRINYLYKKIFKFISTNLSKKYGITLNGTIPAYLLGSLQGYDWTDLPSDVLPYSNLTYGVKRNLWKKKYVGKFLYKTASSLGSVLLKKVPQAEFWDNSEFNGQCPSKLLNLCRDGAMRVSTCSQASLSNFMRAHEDVGKILFNQMAAESTPVLNMANRYSGIEEGVSMLFGILSASPAWLNHTHLMDTTADDQQRMIVSLMITALHTFPQLAYYYSAEMWRINAIEKNITEPADLVASWWKYRQEYEGISSNDTDGPTFLDDSYIVGNEPYLPKILGMMLSFQLYEYTMESTEVRYGNVGGKWMNGNIIKMIQDGGAHDWQHILNERLDIDDITADALVSYFTPLEDFIEENEDNFEYKSGLTEDKELEELEKHILREINAPTTTPIPTIAIKVTPRLPKTKDKSSQYNKEPLKSKLSVQVWTDEPKSDSTESNPPSVLPTTGKPMTVDTTNSAQPGKPKTNTSKTVWVVSAVLVAIITICMIAIFGRQRCRKTPKNRRYV